MNQIEELKKLQKEITFGTRVKTPDGKFGIVNFYCTSIDKCRVFWGFRKYKMYKISKCTILKIEDAIRV